MLFVKILLEESLITWFNIDTDSETELLASCSVSLMMTSFLVLGFYEGKYEFRNFSPL